MSDIISKKLLSEVLGYESHYITREGSVLTVGNGLCDTEGCDCTVEINIYELAWTCKEWCWDKHKQVVVSMMDEHTARTPDKETLWYSSCTLYYEQSLDGFYADTEPEAVFLACQWILEQKER